MPCISIWTNNNDMKVMQYSSFAAIYFGEFYASQEIGELYWSDNLEYFYLLKWWIIWHNFDGKYCSLSFKMLMHFYVRLVVFARKHSLQSAWTNGIIDHMVLFHIGDFTRILLSTTNLLGLSIYPKWIRTSHRHHLTIVNYFFAEFSVTNCQIINSKTIYQFCWYVCSNEYIQQCYYNLHKWTNGLSFCSLFMHSVPFFNRKEKLDGDIFQSD